MSLCKNNNELRATDVDQYIKFSAIDNQTLKIEHKLFMNCCCEDIDIKVDSKKNNIIITITDEVGNCNCICSRTISYKIVNLQINQTYKFVFFRNGLEYQTFELFFTFPMYDEIQYE